MSPGPYGTSPSSGGDRDIRAAREEALAQKRMAQRAAQSGSSDGVTERRPSLAARLRKLLGK